MMALFIEGYPCQEHNNPPDFFLDVINGDPTAVSEDVQAVVQSTGRSLTHGTAGLGTDNPLYPNT